MLWTYFGPTSDALAVVITLFSPSIWAKGMAVPGVLLLKAGCGGAATLLRNKVSLLYLLPGLCQGFSDCKKTDEMT